MLARSRSDIHEVIGGFDEVEVVLHDQHRVPQIAQLAHDVDESMGIAGMQTDGRFIEDVEHAGQTGPEQGSQSQALGFTGRETRRGSLKCQVSHPNFKQAADAFIQII